MTRLAPLLPALALLLLNPACATGSGTGTGSPGAGTLTVDHTQDEADLRQWVATQAKAWNGGDATAWSKDFATDADFVNIVGTVLHGRAEIEQRHAAIFATVYKGSQDQVTVRRIVFPEADLAVVDTLHEVSGHSGLPPGVQNTQPGVLRTQMQYVMKKNQGQWQILTGHNVDVKPAPVK